MRRRPPPPAPTHRGTGARLNGVERMNKRRCGRDPISFLSLRRPFLDMVYSALDCNHDDYHALFVLCLLYAVSHSRGWPLSLSLCQSLCLSLSLGLSASLSLSVYLSLYLCLSLSLSISLFPSVCLSLSLSLCQSLSLSLSHFLFPFVHFAWSRLPWQRLRPQLHFLSSFSRLESCFFFFVHRTVNVLLCISLNEFKYSRSCSRVTRIHLSITMMKTSRRRKDLQCSGFSVRSVLELVCPKFRDPHEL